MGYRIEYYGAKKVRGLEKRVSRLSALVGLCFFLFCVLISVFWPEGLDVVRELVFSGDPEVTTAALESLTIQLQEGDSLQDVLHTFCVQILEGAGLVSGQ